MSEPVLVYLPADRCDISTLRAVLKAVPTPVTVTIARTIKLDRWGLSLSDGMTIASTSQVPTETE